MKIKSIDDQSGWAIIEHEGCDYQILLTDFKDVEEVKAHVLEVAEQMAASAVLPVLPPIGEEL